MTLHTFAKQEFMCMFLTFVLCVYFIRISFVKPFAPCIGDSRNQVFWCRFWFPIHGHAHKPTIFFDC